MFESTEADPAPTTVFIDADDFEPLWNGTSLQVWSPTSLELTRGSRLCLVEVRQIESRTGREIACCVTDVVAQDPLDGGGCVFEFRTTRLVERPDPPSPSMLPITSAAPPVTYPGWVLATRRQDGAAPSQVKVVNCFTLGGSGYAAIPDHVGVFHSLEDAQRFKSLLSQVDQDRLDVFLVEMTLTRA